MVVILWEASGAFAFRSQEGADHGSDEDANAEAGYQSKHGEVREEGYAEDSASGPDWDAKICAQWHLASALVTARAYAV